MDLSLPLLLLVVVVLWFVFRLDDLRNLVFWVIQLAGRGRRTQPGDELQELTAQVLAQCYWIGDNRYLDPIVIELPPVYHDRVTTHSPEFVEQVLKRLNKAGPLHALRTNGKTWPRMRPDELRYRIFPGPAVLVRPDPEADSVADGAASAPERAVRAEGPRHRDLVADLGYPVTDVGYPVTEVAAYDGMPQTESYGAILDLVISGVAVASTIVAPSTRARVGRATGNDLRVPVHLVEVSGLHLVLTCVEGTHEVEVVAAPGRNGTTLVRGGVRTPAFVGDRLRSGDVLELAAAVTVKVH